MNARSLTIAVEALDMQFPVSRAPAPALRRVMRAREYFALAFGSMVGVGWMIVLDDWLARGGSLGAMLGFLVGGVAVIPIVYAYGRLAEQLPESASEIAYTGAVFPRAVSFATGWAMALAYVIVCPYEAVAIGRIASYAIPELNTLELYRVGDYPVYLPHLLLGIGTTLAITLINYWGVGPSTLLQNVTTYGLLLIFGVFATLGLWRGSVAHLPPLFAHEQAAGGSILSVLVVLQIVPYFLQGFETVPKCSEEASGDFAPGRFVRVMFWALAVATLFYITVIGVVALLRPWPELIGVPFPTAAAFEHAFGWPWLVRLIMIGVVLSLLKVYNGTFLAVTRLLYAMGRRGLLGARLGAVHPRYQTPVVAIALVGSLAILGTLLGRAVLVPISEVGSLACAAGWLATSLAYCQGAGGKRTRGARVVGISGATVAGVLIVIVVWGFGIYHWAALAGWTALGLGLWFTRPNWNQTSEPGANER
jgi:amino acid transporter